MLLTRSGLIMITLVGIPQQYLGFHTAIIRTQKLASSMQAEPLDEKKGRLQQESSFFK